MNSTESYIQITDEEGNALEPGQVGELRIRGDNVRTMIRSNHPNADTR